MLLAVLIACQSSMAGAYALPDPDGTKEQTFEEGCNRLLEMEIPDEVESFQRLSGSWRTEEELA